MTPVSENPAIRLSHFQFAAIILAPAAALGVMWGTENTRMSQVEADITTIKMERTVDTNLMHEIDKRLAVFQATLDRVESKIR